jgi:hypothetical protein
MPWAATKTVEFETLWLDAGLIRKNAIEGKDGA